MTLTEPQDYDRRQAALVRIMRGTDDPKPGTTADSFSVYRTELYDLIARLRGAVTASTTTETLEKPRSRVPGETFRVRVEPIGKGSSRSFRVFRACDARLLFLFQRAIRGCEPAEKPNV